MRGLLRHNGPTWTPPPTGLTQHSRLHTEMGPLIPKFDTGTWAFLKIDMRHGAYRQEGHYKRHDKCYFLELTCDISPFKDRHGDLKNSDTGHGNFLNSPCDIGDPRQGPQRGGPGAKPNLNMEVKSIKNTHLAMDYKPSQVCLLCRPSFQTLI